MRNTIIAAIAGIIAGALGGAAIDHILMQKDCDKQIASVKEMFTVPRSYPPKEVPALAKKDDDIHEEKEHDSSLNREKPSISEYYKLSQGYLNQKAPVTIEKTLDEDIRVEKETELIHVIPPSQFGQQPDWETFTLKWYANHILVDEDERVIEDPSDIIGPTALTSFGLYEPDCVYVVNEDGECYYEVIAMDEDYEVRDAYGD